MDSKEFRRADFTLKGRIFYPRLTTPEPNMKGLLKYNVLFAWPMAEQEEAMKRINAHLVAAKNAFFAKIPASSMQLPIKAWGKYTRKDGSPNPEFLRDCYWMNLSSGEKFKPVVVDTRRQPVIDPVEIYSGRNAVLNFSFYEYSNQNYGISANIKAIMLLDGGEQVAAGGVNVEEAFKGFVEDSLSVGGSFSDSESLI